MFSKYIEFCIKIYFLTVITSIYINFMFYFKKITEIKMTDIDGFGFSI